MIKNLTCIICPKGCNITLEFHDKEIISIKGNKCNRGSEYVKNELICPKRTITTTVKTKDGVPIAVKTDKPIDKSKIFDCMEIINKTQVNTPIKVGDIIIKNIFDTEVNIIATQNKK